MNQYTTSSSLFPFKNVSSFFFLLLPSLLLPSLFLFFSYSLSGHRHFLDPSFHSASFHHAQAFPAAGWCPGATWACARSHAGKWRKMEALNIPRNRDLVRTATGTFWAVGWNQHLPGVAHRTLLENSGDEAAKGWRLPSRTGGEFC